ncbi:MAG: alpha-amylase, partial [Acidobacteriota bacterium]
MSKLHLILAFHNHQPVGNFDHVLEDCYRKSYLPFLETLLDHPALKIVLHYSGHLLAWMQERHSEAIDIIRTLVEKGRVEILSGGLYEPILPVLPEKDRVLQVSEMSKFVRKSLGYTPKGMWLAERVWEPQMPRFIAKAGMAYVPIDDYHFKLTGLEDDQLLGYYLTEDEGSEICVFPGSEKLRYYIPYRTVDDNLSYFREVADRGGDPLLTMADDGEKFGVWPKTYKHCY